MEFLDSYRDKKGNIMQIFCMTQLIELSCILLYISAIILKDIN